MGVKEEIFLIKTKLSIAHDNGDVYAYIELTYRRLGYWEQQQINEILRGLRDVDARIISMSQDNGATFLFEMIYK